MRIRHTYKFNEGPFEEGTLHDSKKCGTYEILTIGKLKSTVRFIETGYTVTQNTSAVKRGCIHDPTYPLIYSKGCIGKDYKIICDAHGYSLIRSLYIRWKNMLSRCYNKKHEDYKSYGQLGITVCDRWCTFCNYAIDVMTLPGWDKDRYLNKEITLDKDKLQIDKDPSDKIYSAETCCWLTTKEQNELVDFQKAHEYEMRKFIVIHPDGTVEERAGIRKYADEIHEPEYRVNSWIKNHSPKTINGCIAQLI